MKKLFLSIVMASVLAACSRPYTIVQIADAQLGFTASDRCKTEGREYDEDITYELDYLKKAVAKVNEISPDALVFTGDQVHNINNQKEWSAFKTAVAAVSDDVKIFHLPGNHDIHIGINEVNMEPFEERYGKGSFVYEDGNIRLIGMNTNFIKYDDPRENEQFEWLVKVLGKQKGQTCLVFGHHPFFLEDIGEDDGYFQIQKNKRKVYFDLFSRKGVNGVFAGHLHDNAEGEYKGIPAYTATSVAFQAGDAVPAIRLISVRRGVVSTEMIPLD